MHEGDLTRHQASHYWSYRKAMAEGYSIFAHSRPDKIGTPRLLPLDFQNISSDYRSTTRRAKESAQILYPRNNYIEIQEVS